MGRLKYLALIFSLILVGCSGESEDPKGPTQVAVKVNGEEVTVHELNSYLSRVSVAGKSEEELEAIKAGVLNKLIEQTLLIQASKEAELDRKPEVLSAIQVAKDKVLVDSYMQRMLQGVPSSSVKEIKEFYDESSLIFAERKYFVYEQFLISGDKEFVEKLVTKIKLIDDIKGFKKLLDTESIEFKYGKFFKTSEQLPRPLLKPMNSIKSGDIGLLRMPDGLIVLALKESHDEPISYEKAKVLIERQLLKKKQQQAANRVLESLKTKATVEYSPGYDELKKPKDEK